jgi:hypothetical protein
VSQSVSAGRRSFLVQVFLLAQQVARGFSLPKPVTQPTGQQSRFSAGRISSLASGLPGVLANDWITAQFDARGLRLIYDHRLKKAFELRSDEFSLMLSGQEIRSENLPLPVISREPSRLIYLFNASAYKITATYELRPGWAFVSKQLAVTSSVLNRTVRVDSVEVITNHLDRNASSVLAVQSPWSSLRVLTKNYGVFVRFDDRTGIFMLVQNPFLDVLRGGGRLALGYSPAWTGSRIAAPFNRTEAALERTRSQDTKRRRN